MKRYTIGLITGVLLTASAVMFMGAVQNKQNGRYAEYSNTAFSAFTLVEGQLLFSGLDTKTGDVIINVMDDNVIELQVKHSLVNGETMGRTKNNGEWSEWKENN